MKLSAFHLLATLALLTLSNSVFPAPIGSENEVPVVVQLSGGRNYTDVTHLGKPVRIERNQDRTHLLADDYRRTSRPCPPFCIQPIELAPGINTVGELEVIEFVQQKVKKGTGLLLDVRMPRFYDSETIPGAVNIPFLLIKQDVRDVLPLLGVRRGAQGWDFSRAKFLLIFCNGPWCSQSARSVDVLRGVNYPAEKLYYYRGGMQNWKMLGLSTVSQ